LAAASPRLAAGARGALRGSPAHHPRPTAATQVPRDPSDPPTLAELRAFVGAELASFKRPDGLTVLAELPLTPMFKVDKRALRERR